MHLTTAVLAGCSQGSQASRSARPRKSQVRHLAPRRGTPQRPFAKAQHPSPFAHMTFVPSESPYVLVLQQ